MLDCGEVRLPEIVVIDGPVGYGTTLGDRFLPPALDDVRAKTEVVWMKAAEPGAVMNDRSTDAIHHTPQRKGCLDRQLTR